MNVKINSAIDYYAELIQQIKDALGTDEDDYELVKIARNAHRAEMDLAAILRKQQEEEE